MRSAYAGAPQQSDPRYADAEYILSTALNIMPLTN